MERRPSSFIVSFSSTVGSDENISISRSLDGEFTGVSHFGRGIHGLEDQLADLHAGLQDHAHGAEVPDFQLDRATRIIGLFGLIAESRVNGRRGYMDAETEPGQAALAFDTRRNPGAIRKLQAFHGPAEAKIAWTYNMPFGRHLNR